MSQLSPTVIQILKQSLRCIEQTAEYRENAQAALKLRRQLLRNIAQLEIQKSDREVRSELFACSSEKSMMDDYHRTGNKDAFGGVLLAER